MECPLYGKEVVKAIYYPPVLQMKRLSSAAVRTKIKFYHTKERYEIISGCEICVKSEKEVQ
ncbi:MAG: hypothetical protein ACUVQ8_08910 [Nitrososphaeria archaeon]